MQQLMQTAEIGANPNRKREDIVPLGQERGGEAGEQLSHSLGPRIGDHNPR